MVIQKFLYTSLLPVPKIKYFFRICSAFTVRGKPQPEKQNFSSQMKNLRIDILIRHNAAPCAIIQIRMPDSLFRIPEALPVHLKDSFIPVYAAVQKRRSGEIIMKKTFRIFCSLCAILLVILACGPLSAKAGENLKTISVPEDADAFVQILVNGDPASLDGQYKLSGMMKLAMIPLGGFKGLSKQLDSLGAVQEIFPAYEENSQGRTTFRVPCIFAASSVDFVLAMDGDALAGLTIDRFTGEVPRQQDDVFSSVDLALPVPELNGELPGTLTLPEGSGPFPAVVLIHGSGPNDRDERIGSLTPFKDIAEGLNKLGIAVYRFDKRTYVYGKELAADKQGTLMDESILDAVAAVQLLAGQEAIDPDRIFVLGHSLGAQAIPAIDRELKNAPVQACGYILMAPSARRLDALMKEQLEFLAGFSEAAAAQRDRMLPELEKLNDLDSLSDDDQIAGAYAPYWKWLASYDVLDTARQITLPCLLLQGEEDYQVTMEDFRLFQEALEDKENWTFHSYPGLIHVFIHGKMEDGPAAYEVNERIDPEVIGDIADFIQTETPSEE